jgi:preprotein translocase subunit YajC
MTKMVLSATHLLLAQAAAPAVAPAQAAAGQSQGGISGGMVLAYGLLAVAMYFLMFAPQMKKQKEQAKMLAALQVGDEIVTTGGIFGVITSVKDDRFVVRIADNTKVELGKAFVHAALKEPSAGDKK